MLALKAPLPKSVQPGEAEAALPNEVAEVAVAEEPVEAEVEEEDPIIKIKLSPILLTTTLIIILATTKQGRSLIKKAQRPPQMFQLTRVRVTGRKVALRPTVLTL